LIFISTSYAYRQHFNTINYLFHIISHYLLHYFILVFPALAFDSLVIMIVCRLLPAIALAAVGVIISYRRWRRWLCAASTPRNDGDFTAAAAATPGRGRQPREQHHIPGVADTPPRLRRFSTMPVYYAGLLAATTRRVDDMVPQSLDGPFVYQ
jgi:hypothetical protein